MRTHRNNAAFVAWRDPQVLRDLVDIRFLCAARLEPSGAGRPTSAGLDLTFFDGKRVAVVPFIEISAEMLEQRECSPFIWPAAFAASNAGGTDTIESALLPWIESLTMHQALAGEVVRVFGDKLGAELFQTARSYGFTGAVAHRDVVSDALPYLYAIRFAQDKRVAVRDVRGAAGAAMLARHAVSVRADLGDDERDAFASLWFDAAMFGVLEDSYDVAVLSREAASVEAPVVVRAGELERCPSRHVREAAVVEWHAQGGSGGRIFLAMRDDWRGAPDADVDDVLALAARLRSEGFSVDVDGASSRDPRSYDLVHGWTAASPLELRALFARAAAANVPAVITAGLEDTLDEGWWGTAIVPQISQIADDEISLDEHLTMLARRKLEAPGIAPGCRPFTGYDQALREICASAGAAIVASEQEEALLRRLGFAGPAFTVAAHIESEPLAAPLEALVGTGDFILSHAPIEPRSNQYLLLRAAAQAQLPIVLAGPVTDFRYHRDLRKAAGENVIFIPEPDAGTRESLYRAARVFADVAWIRLGIGRIVRAARAGCALVVAKRSNAAAWGPGIWEADPAGIASMACALGDAWLYARGRRGEIEACRSRVSAACAPQAALVATVSAYAAAQRNPAPA